MQKKMKHLFVLLLACCGLCSGDVYWRDWSVDHIWGNPANWDGSAVPTAASGIVNVQAGSIVSPKGYPVIYSNVPEIYRLTVGGSGSGIASVTVNSSGSLNVQYILRLGHYSSIDSDVHGKMLVKGGNVTVGTGGFIDVGNLRTDGTLTINSGSVNTPRINVPGSNYGTGIVYLNGGSLNVGVDGLKITNDSVLSKYGKIDISGGRLVVDGDARILVKSYIAQGLIVAYDNNSTLNLDYDQTYLGKTTITANSYDPFLARVPMPAIGKTEVPIDGMLVWRGGDWAQQHDVYIGTNPDEVEAATNMVADVDGDGWIGIGDVLTVGENWLSVTAGAGGDINRSGRVDLGDFILIAKDYDKPAPDVYKGRFDVSSYDYEGLDYGTNYYWRVDEVNGDMLWRGDMWSFTSKIYVNDTKDGWELTFSDEFNGDDMDWTVWASEAGYPTHILSSRWPENAVVESGMLKLLTKKESRGGAEWTTGNIWTRNFRQKYGYWEASYRIGAAAGLNNAFWMIKGGDFEIDIDEGHYPDTMNMNLHNWAGEHWATGATYTSGLPLSQEFHKRGLEWTPTELIYYFDDVEVHRVDYSVLDIYPDEEVEVRLSTAVISWAGEITDALDGTSMDIDYVRIYKPRDLEVDPAMIIDPSAFVATASNTSQYGARQPVYAVNGAGLIDDAHVTTADNAMWMADVVSNWFKIDLGQSHELDLMKVWNFNMAGFTTRGINQADVYYSNSETDPGNPWDNPANWILMGEPGRTFTQASGRSDYGTNVEFTMPDIVDMHGVNARWIVFDIKTNHGGNPYTGLSEVQVIKRP